MDPIECYLDQLQQNLQIGQATEHTHRPALQILIQSLLPSVHALNEFSHIAYSTYLVAGNNQVEKIDYKDEKVYINKTQYFDHVKLDVWEFYIGGYQVCQKWLKDRKGRALSYDDCEHYRYIVAAIERTIALMEEIDDIIPGFPLP